jgi:hypothetical protein
VTAKSIPVEGFKLLLIGRVEIDTQFTLNPHGESLVETRRIRIAGPADAQVFLGSVIRLDDCRPKKQGSQRPAISFPVSSNRIKQRKAEPEGVDAGLALRHISTSTNLAIQ